MRAAARRGPVFRRRGLSRIEKFDVLTAARKTSSRQNVEEICGQPYPGDHLFLA